MSRTPDDDDRARDRPWVLGPEPWGADIDPEDDCLDASGHRWVLDSDHEGPGDPRSYCERCGMDGDA